ncbi:MAG: efflux RND transporter permease subunit, partial [Bacteroidota bacterium]
VEASRKRIQKDSTLVGNFITRDRKGVCAYFFINEEIFDSRDRDLLNYEILRRVEASGFEHVLSGIPFIRTQYIDKIGSELILFTGLSILLIATVLFLTYRNFWGVLIPMAAVVISLIWILGIMGATDQSINLISNLLIPIMFVVGTSDVIHLTTKYLHELRAGLKPREAMEKSLREIGLSIFLTSVTTAVGFASLLISRITPIRDFGLYAAIGVLITYAISVIILPGGLLRLPAKTFLKGRSLENSGGWDAWLLRLHKFTLRSEKSIGWSAVAILALCLFLITQVSTDSFLIEDIGPNDPIRTSMEFFERETYGLRPFEMGIHVKDTSHRVTDREILVEMAKMQAFLQERESFSPFISLATFVQEGNYLYHNSRDRYRKIPDTQAAVDELIAYAELNDGGSLLAQVTSPDAKMARLSSRLPDIGTNAFETLYADLENYVNAECDTSLFSYRPTGHA